jgi:hypothetical protein
MSNQTAFGPTGLLIVLACLGFVACGDDEGGDAGVAGSAAGSSGAAGAAGASGAAAGMSGGGAGRGTTAGTGMQPVMCSKPAPTAPVVCGGVTCPTPAGYQMNMCVYACCATVNGAQVCGAESANPMFATGCEPPAVVDPTCPDVDNMGTPLKGCCNVAMGKCGIVSTVRPGCITSSQLIMLPENPLSCDGSGDGGVPDDAGL